MAEGNSIQLEADAGRGALRATVRSGWLSIDPAWRWALTLFLGYRALFSIWAAWVSSVYPHYAEEAAITIWPINATLDYWLQRTLLWPFARYDVIWYTGIAEQGYAYRAGSTAFHPLYPLLIG